MSARKEVVISGALVFIGHIGQSPCYFLLLHHGFRSWLAIDRSFDVLRDGGGGSEESGMILKWHFHTQCLFWYVDTNEKLEWNSESQQDSKHFMMHTRHWADYKST